MSAELAELSINRSGIPEFGSPGDNYATRLIIGRDAAMASIRKYVPDLKYDEPAASKTLRDIDVWEQRNRDELSVVMSDQSASALPAKIQTSLGSDKASAFIVAVFTTAASGLGPWSSGAVGKAASVGGTMNTEWARVDAETRLRVFGGIVKMEQDGQLSKFFVTPAGAAGFGIVQAVVVWAIVVAAVALASLILVYFYSAKKLELNNKLMRDLCESAQRSGDKSTIADCIGATKDLQSEGFVPTSWVGMAIFGGVVLGGVYVAAKYVPWGDVLSKHGASRDPRSEKQ